MSILSPLSSPRVLCNMIDIQSFQTTGWDKLETWPPGVLQKLASTAKRSQNSSSNPIPHVHYSPPTDRIGWHLPSSIALCPWLLDSFSLSRTHSSDSIHSFAAPSCTQKLCNCHSLQSLLGITGSIHRCRCHCCLTDRSPQTTTTF